MSRFILPIPRSHIKRSKHVKKFIEMGFDVTPTTHDLQIAKTEKSNNQQCDVRETQDDFIFYYKHQIVFYIKKTGELMQP
jgi:hypothetical protein